jgi:transposase-like protein
MIAPLEPDMTLTLSDPIFKDADKARRHLEKQRWPNGARCPHCQERELPGDNVRALKGKSHRPGVYQCNDCRQQFTVTVGTVFERSKIPLNTWLLATFLLSSSKKGMSAHQLHRMIGVTYKTAWFMFHRIREAMREGDDGYKAGGGGLGGEGKTVEVDETYIGRKSTTKAFKKPAKKQIVMSLVERGGRVRSFHVANVTGDTVKRVLRTQIHRSSELMTDQAHTYKKVGAEFAKHRHVNHSIKEYVRGEDHTNTVESYFGILKRGLMGSYHHVSEAHLKRYLGEFDFRYNARKDTDTERTNAALQGISGKRLTYRRTGEAAHA